MRNLRKNACQDAHFESEPDAVIEDRLRTEVPTNVPKSAGSWPNLRHANWSAEQGCGRSEPPRLNPEAGVTDWELAASEQRP